MIAVEDSDYTRFLAEWGRKCRPEAVLVFTAHWERNVTTITCTDDVYGMIYDFGGFPEELYRVVYPAKGSTRIAKRAEELLRAADIPVRLDESRGLDHGTWTLLCRIFPEADIPVVQASVNPFLPPADQYRIGQALRALGKENVLVIGSGATVHNLFAIRWGQTEPEPWADPCSNTKPSRPTRAWRCPVRSISFRCFWRWAAATANRTSCSGSTNTGRSVI